MYCNKVYYYYSQRTCQIKHISAIKIHRLIVIRIDLLLLNRPNRSTNLILYTAIKHNQYVHIISMYASKLYTIECTHNMYTFTCKYTCICLADLDSTVMLPSASLHRLVYSSGLMDTFLSRARNLVYMMRCEVYIHEGDVDIWCM